MNKKKEGEQVTREWLYKQHMEAMYDKELIKELLNYVPCKKQQEPRKQKE